MAGQSARRWFRNSMAAVVVGAASVSTIGGNAQPVRAATNSRVSVGDAQVVEGDSGLGRVMTFALTLDTPSTTDVRVDWMLLPGTATAGARAGAGVDFLDYGGVMKKTTIKAGKVSQFINVTIYADTATEANETFQLHLMNASNPSNDVSLNDHMGDGTIFDDDATTGVRIGVGDLSVHEGNSLDRRVEFWVTLSAPAPALVTVNATLMAIDTTSGADFAPLSKTISFSAGQYKKPIMAIVHPDAIAEGNEQFHVMLDNQSANASIVNAIGMVTIIDDDGQFPLTTSQHRIGPFNLTAAGTAGFENEGFGAAPRPAGVVGIKNMRFDLVDAAGNHLDHHSVHFHHVVLLDQGRNDSLCPSLGYNRFSGAGKERQPLQLPGNYVYKTDASSAWAASWHVMNMSTTPKTVYIQYQIDYVTGADLASTRNVNTYFYDVDNCWGDSQFVVPGTGGPGSVYSKSITYTAPRAGVRVYSGGHLHDGGIDITTKRTASNQVVCTATATYDSMGMLATINSCPNSSSIAAGEQFTVTARYENDTMIPDAMGIQLSYVDEN